MTRADICGADDDDGIDRLKTALRDCGLLGNSDYHDSPLGVGLMTYRRGEAVLTVFIDAWCVDIAGPDELVREVLEALSSG